MPKKPAVKSLRLVVAINPSASFGKRKAVGPALVSTLRGLGHEVTSLTEPSYAELVDAGRRAIQWSAVEVSVSSRGVSTRLEVLSFRSAHSMWAPVFS